MEVLYIHSLQNYFVELAQNAYFYFSKKERKYQIF